MTSPQQPDPNPPTRRFRINLIYLVIAIVAINLLQGLFIARFQPKKATYSQFRRAVESGLVREIAIGAEDIVWAQVADAATGEGEGDPTAAAETGEPGGWAVAGDESPSPDEAGKPELQRYRADRIPGIPDEEVIHELLSGDENVEILGVPPDTFWPIVMSWLFPILLFAGIWLFMARRLGGAARSALSLGRSQHKVWDQSTEKITFADVAGVDEAVAELKEVVDFLQNTEKYTRVGARIPKGILLTGPPGTGKTLIAKATAGEAKVPFFSMSGADFVEMFVGVGAARVRDLFKQAREKAPCIVFIDEIDAIGRTRAGAKSPGVHEEREQTLNQLLVEMDGFDSTTGVILMAATNRPELLDKALLRPGRFDRQVGVDPPDLKGREAILRVHVKKVKLGADVDLHVVAARTPGFAGADLANVINEAALLGVRRGREFITMDELDEAIDRVMAGLERKSRALVPMEREIVAHHEMGHALCALLLPHADPVHKVSIIPRGSAALGVTIQAPLEDRYLLTEEELVDRLAVLLGGRAAEEVAFQHVSTGASDDLQRASDLARRMVVNFGMSREIGPVALEDAPQNGEMFLARHYSEQTAERIDAEVKRIIETGYERAREVIAANRDAFLCVSRQLLEKEVMDGDELAAALRQQGVIIAAKEGSAVVGETGAIQTPPGKSSP